MALKNLCWAKIGGPTRAVFPFLHTGSAYWVRIKGWCNFGVALDKPTVVSNKPKEWSDLLNGCRSSPVLHSCSLFRMPGYSVSGDDMATVGHLSWNRLHLCWCFRPWLTAFQSSRCRMWVSQSEEYTTTSSKYMRRDSLTRPPMHRCISLWKVAGTLPDSPESTWKTLTRGHRRGAWKPVSAFFQAVVHCPTAHSKKLWKQHQ